MTHGSFDSFVRVRGAREHNLRNVDVDLPRDAFVVFTGISGSGKSSLAFGTLYAEAQRRYLESVAPYVRRLIRQAGTPHVDSITGLPPAVALRQQRSVATSRSTVGTLTTLSNALRMLFSRAGTHPPDLQARLSAGDFSPNTPQGACPECHGLGQVHTVTEASLVPDPTLSIRDGAIAAWPGAWQGKNLRDIVIALGYDVDKPWNKLPKAKRNWLLFTDAQPVVEVEPGEDRNEYAYNGKFVSAKRHVLQTLAQSKSEQMRERALRYVVPAPCPACHGARLRPDALRVTFARKNIAELNALPMSELARALRPVAERTEPGRSPEQSEAAIAIARDIAARIEVLLELGLGYLSVDRSSVSLSPGEAQRLRVASQLRSGLFGVVYVLDEPSAGLHPADSQPLIEVLARLRRAGNSLFVVEHDMDVVRRADWVVDVGPGAGERGGRVLYSGPVPGLADVEASVTRRFLFEADAATAPSSLRKPRSWLRLRHVTRHNLSDVEVAFPVGVMTAVTGVSGSGKTTLVTQVLTSVVARHLDLTVEEAVDLAEVQATGLESIARLAQVDQKPIGRTPRSNLATYTGLFDAVRKLFAETPSAKRRRWSPGRFSFNVPEGRCETCRGEGFVAVELMYLPGTHSPCPSCHGARYDARTLEVQYRGKNIAEVLALSVDEAAEFLAEHSNIHRSLSTLREVGLGYLRLGQPATELSGGEAQRIKLATELQRSAKQHTLYVLDEPTTSLHPADVELLMRQLERLVEAGHTVIVVEHEMGIVARCDWVIDLGPGGGDAGGRIVAQGPPADVARAANSRTAPFLAKRLAPT